MNGCDSPLFRGLGPLQRCCIVWQFQPSWGNCAEAMHYATAPIIWPLRIPWNFVSFPAWNINNEAFRVYIAALSKLSKRIYRVPCQWGWLEYLKLYINFLIIVQNSLEPAGHILISSQWAYKLIEDQNNKDFLLILKFRPLKPLEEGGWDLSPSYSIRYC